MSEGANLDADRVVLYPSRAQMALVFLGSIAFVIAGVAIGLSGLAGAPWTGFVACYLGVPFFTASALYAGYRIAVRRPALVIDTVGIADSASAFGAGHLRWDEVDHIVLFRISNQLMMGILPRDLEGYLDRQSAPKRTMLKIGLAMGSPPIAVPQAGLDVSLSELASTLRARYGVRVVGEA